MNFKLEDGGVVRLDDGAHIPDAPSNPENSKRAMIAAGRGLTMRRIKKRPRRTL
jgi:hypothetical protein